jgi:tripartite-type tricarboxylate transporter receptor subunit TctC
VKSMSELVALARSAPGRIQFASSGVGSVVHLATELLAATAGFSLNHVPYKGTGPALADTISGQTNALLGSTAATLPHVRSGRLRALAVTTPRRLPAEPGIPTVAESGVPGYEAVIWHGFVAPKGLPAPIVARLNAELNRILELEETARQLQNDGVAPIGGSPDQFLAVIRREIEVWRKVAGEARIRAE